jgi:hypothetical protein
VNFGDLVVSPLSRPSARHLSRDSPQDADCLCVNLLKPTGYVKHQSVQHSTIVGSAHTFYVFCIYLRINSDSCHLHHKLFGFCNRAKKCLQRGMERVFK